MTNIVVEGPDNSGKTSLIYYLNESFLWPRVHSGGPEKYPGEIDHRIEQLTRDYPTGHLFDRHPAVSECMYAFIRNAPGPSPYSLNLFYSTLPIIVYCRPVEGRDAMEGHQLNEDIDTPEHLEGVHRHYGEIARRYDEWALQRATLVYRIGDDRHRILTALRGMIYG